MVKRLYADIPRFKKVERAMRKAVAECAALLAEVETASAGKRSPQETAVLDAIRWEAKAAHDRIKASIHSLYEVAEE